MKNVVKTHIISGGKLTLASLGVITAILSLSLLAVAGCGGSSSSDTGSQPAGVVGQLQRPAPGTEKILDGQHDAKYGQNVKTVPTWLDINYASISKEGDNLKFSMDMAGRVPNALGPGQPGAAEAVFLLDTDKDGTPDWGIFADFNSKGWTPGIFNVKTKERLTGDKFTGTFANQGTTLVLTLSPSAFGSPDSFRWLAALDALMILSSDDREHVTDLVPDNVTSDKSDGWPEYP